MNHKHFYVVGLFFLVFLNAVSSQGPGNNGPIFEGTSDLYCANRAPPHYPWWEDGILGNWTLTHLYQQNPRYEIRCGSVSISNLNSSARYLAVSHKRPMTETPMDRSQVTLNGDSTAPTRWKTTKDGGLIGDSNTFIPTGGSVTFMGFTRGHGGQPTYGTALYAVCYHGGGVGFGSSNIAEVGILSKTGEISSYYLDHYKGLLGNAQTLGGGVLREVEKC